MEKLYILLVEDEAVLHKRLKTLLEDHNYEVSDYIPSVQDAIQSIDQRKPDLALLDIRLIDDIYGGIKIGKYLNEQYQIPFIFITEMDDDDTFNKALEVHHEFFISKTKPDIDERHLIRTIQTALMHQESNKNASQYIEAMVDYAEKLRDYSKGMITKLRINLDNVVLITTKEYYDENDKPQTPATNYVAVLTDKNEYYFKRITLVQLDDSLPDFIARINGKYLINVKSHCITGLTKDHKVVVRVPKTDNTFRTEYIPITNTYRNSFIEVYNSYNL